jgi:dolichol-phosphate mannosyltransferase
MKRIVPTAGRRHMKDNELKTPETGEDALPELQVVVPVHNEAQNVEEVLRELHEQLRRLRIEIIVCEDGSTDGTAEVLRRLQGDLPLRLLLSPRRKGYSRAVIDGLDAVTSDYALCIDGDGQCDPEDFWSFWGLRSSYEVVIGYRRRRADPWSRRLMSGAFRAFWRVLFWSRIKDPSCPYILIRKDVIRALAPRLGVLSQGFWWEFVARAGRAGFRIGELPVRYRSRKGGATRIYHPLRIPGIALSHLAGLLKIRLGG